MSRRPDVRWYVPHRSIATVLFLVALAGCRKETPSVAPSFDPDPSVGVARPAKRTIVRHVAQPGTIEAYEQTAVYTRLSGYVKSWKVDIGDRVKRGDLLVELDVPDLVEEDKQKQAQVQLDREMTTQAKDLVAVAESNRQAAVEEVTEAKADVKRYQADVRRWDDEVARLTKLVEERAVQRELLVEMVNRQKASQSALEASRGRVRTKEALREAAVAGLTKANTDVKVAGARVAMSEADQRRVAALVSYTRLLAPYDGVVVSRNVNTGDFVRPSGGDASTGPSVLTRRPARETPLYVVARTDRLLLVVGAPERDAGSVGKGTPVTVRISALDDLELEGMVARTSWTLNSQTRTLHVEIDLFNPDGKLLPGMYAYATLRLERKGVMALPVTSVTDIGNQPCCYQVIQGKAVRTRLQVGLSDGVWQEVRAKYVPAGPGGQGKWEPLSGDEQVITENLESLSDGQPVEVAKPQP